MNSLNIPQDSLNKNPDESLKKVNKYIARNTLTALEIQDYLVNRDTLAHEIEKNRYLNGIEGRNRGVPQGHVLLNIAKNHKVQIEGFPFYNSFRDKYDEAIADNDLERMQQLDTELAELLVLYSSDDNDPYWIQIDNPEITKGNPNYKTYFQLVGDGLRCENSLNDSTPFEVEYVQIENGNKRKIHAVRKKLASSETPDLDPTPDEPVKPSPTPDDPKTPDLKPDPVKYDPTLLPVKYTGADQNLIKEIDPKTKINSNNKEDEKIVYEDTLEISAVLSDVKNVHQENARLTAEEEIKKQYNELKSGGMLKKIGFFLTRGKKRKDLVKKYMENASDKVFTNNDNDTELTSAANRHSIEANNSFGSINTVTETLHDIPAINELSKEYLLGHIDETQFKNRFNEIVSDDTELQKLLKDNNIQYISSNILDNLKLQKGQFVLLDNLADILTEGGDTDAIMNRIEDYIKEYQQSPAFFKEIKKYLDAKNLPALERYLKHKKASRKILLDNLKIKLAVLNQGKYAYQIDNSRQEKGIYKITHALDKLPTIAQIGVYGGAATLLAIGGGALGLGAAATTGLVALGIGGTNFIKKWGHYTKEHNTHEKNLVTDYNAEKEKITRWQEKLLSGGTEKRWKKYTSRKGYVAARQLELYNNATHTNIELAKDVTQSILSFATSVRDLSATEEVALKRALLEAKIRLDAYQSTGHNFLASDGITSIEQDMNALQKALMLGASKLGVDYKDINIFAFPADEEGGKEITYDNLVQDLQNNYEDVSKKFKNERLWLSTKYGIATAGLSYGTAWLSHWISAKLTAGAGAHDIINEAAGTDTFGLGGHSLGTSQIEATTKSALSSLQPNADVVVNYGAGTDATLLKLGSSLNSYTDYMTEIGKITSHVSSLPLGADQKAELLKELTARTWEHGWGAGFTNDYLHGMRAAEALKEVANGLAASGNTTANITLHHVGSVAGRTLHATSERFANIGLQITDHIAGSAGRSYWVPLPRVFNTFKKDNTPEENDKVQPENKDKNKIKTIEDDKDDKKSSSIQIAEQDKTPTLKVREEEQSESDVNSQVLAHYKPSFWNRVKTYVKKTLSGSDKSAPAKEAQEATEKEKKLDALYDKLLMSKVQFDTADGKKADMIDFLGRKIVVLKVGDMNLPFYRSSGRNHKPGVSKGKWYPIFGIGIDGWINKSVGLEKYYDNPHFKKLAEKLDTLYPENQDSGEEIVITKRNIENNILSKEKVEALAAVNKNMKEVSSRNDFSSNNFIKDVKNTEKELQEYLDKNM